MADRPRRRGRTDRPAQHARRPPPVRPGPRPRQRARALLDRGRPHALGGLNSPTVTQGDG
ncbi:hypothetical protein DEJ44_13380 [Streptomyces venezuelae]|nr:hypothetical protein DEJ44_13380 [Streptomyces venezuelae]